MRAANPAALDEMERGARSEDLRFRDYPSGRERAGARHQLKLDGQ